MALTTPMVLTDSHGIVSILLNHTRTREPNVALMHDFFLMYIYIFFLLLSFFLLFYL